jgi:methionyl-tRNA formyltransferase
MKVIFFGTPRFAADVLSYLLKHGIDIVAVVTKPDRPQGRSTTPVPTPVKCIAENCQPPIPVFQPETVSAMEYVPVLEAFQADLFVVVAYGEIIKQHLLDMPKVACINLHASLLPTYRGAAPIQRCIMNGETETGVTIMHMAKKMDAGDIIAMQKTKIGPDMTYGDLEAELCRIGSELLLQTIQNFESGKNTRTPQDHSLATFASKIEIEDCQIDWTHTAQQIHNQVRAVTPHPGAWCEVMLKDQKKRMRIIQTKMVSQDATDVPAPKGKLYINCGKGTIELVQIQLEGKKVMTAEEFLRGMPADALQFAKVSP